MGFSSLFFLYAFLPIFLILFFLLKKESHNYFLLIISILFYTWGEGKYILLLLTNIILNYSTGLLLEKIKLGKTRKHIFLFNIILNLSLLIYFKYTHFILDNIGILINVKTIYLPLALSFYTFQAISFITDIYRKSIKMDKNLLNFSLYMMFFPKLINGPIIPYNAMKKQIADHRKISLDNISEGIKRLILGLGKKVLIADSLAITANSIFSIPPQDQTMLLSWIGALFYSLQIYFDFSGYTDIAIGIGRICGFRLLENFNYPYISRSIKEFWQRWHISLANWLRDYLFLPIAYSLSRKIKKQRLLSIKTDNWIYFISAFITFLLCGVWHGANWTFIVWGAYYGILLIIEQMGLGKKLKRLKWKVIPLLYTQILVIFGWVIFRSEDLFYAFSYLKAMVGLGTGSSVIYYPALYLNNEALFYLAIGIIGSTPFFVHMHKNLPGVFFVNKQQKSSGLQALHIYTYHIIYNLFLGSILIAVTINLVGGTYNPFIYARF